MKRRAVGIVGVSSSVEELTGRKMWEAVLEELEIIIGIVAIKKTRGS